MFTPTMFTRRRHPRLTLEGTKKCHFRNSYIIYYIITVIYLVITIVLTIVMIMIIFLLLLLLLLLLLNCSNNDNHNNDDDNSNATSAPAWHFTGEDESLRSSPQFSEAFPQELRRDVSNTFLHLSYMDVQTPKVMLYRVVLVISKCIQAFLS